MRNYRDIKAVFVGSTLILFVGAYFIGRAFFTSPGTSVDTGNISENTAADKTAPVIAPDVLQKKIQNGETIRLVDIRPSEDYKTEHIPYSLSLPLSALGGFSPEKDEQVVVIFSEQDGQTFETAKNILDQKSYTHFFLQGGLEAWKAGSYPTVSFGDPNSFVDQSKVTYISPTEFKTLLADPLAKIFILDVQSAENFSKNHIKGATNIPLDQLEKRLKEISPAKLVIVYGENELTSFQAGVRLSDLNILAVKTLSGNDHLAPASPLPVERK